MTNDANYRQEKVSDMLSRLVIVP